MNDIPVFDPDTLSHTPAEGLIDLLIEHEERVPRVLLDATAAEQEAGPRFGRMFGSDDVARSFEGAKDMPKWVRRSEPWKFYDDAQIQARQKRWREEDAAHDNEPFASFHEPASCIEGVTA